MMSKVKSFFVFMCMLFVCFVSNANETSVEEDWYASGERLHYDVKFWAFKAGEAEILYKPLEGDLYKIVARSWGGSPSGSLFFIRDRISIQGRHGKSPFLTEEYHVNLNENDYRADKVVTYNRMHNQTGYKNNREPESPVRLFSVAEETRDALSALLHLRREIQGEMNVGDVYKTPVFDLNSAYTLELNVLGKERMDTALGKKTPVVHLQPYLRSVNQGEKDSNRWHLWVTDDERRIPVKIQAKLKFGSFTAVLNLRGDAKSASLAPKDLPPEGEFSVSEAGDKAREKFINPIPD